FLCMFLTVTTTISMCMPAFANDAGATVSVDAVTQTDQQNVITVAPVTPESAAQAPAVELQPAAPVTPAAETQTPVQETSQTPTTQGKAYLALGADLTQDQLATVLNLMGIPVTDLGNYNVIYVTNADERQYLNGYIDSAVIGTKSLSSVLVKPAEAGHGVVVSTKNINYCTTDMYRSALVTAGVKDADIVVVGPTSISGTAGLIGALKAYEVMSGTSIPENTIDTAMNELVLTGQISDAVGNDKEAEELIAYIKAQIAANDLNTKEEIEAVVRQGVVDLNANISEAEIQQIIDLMIKIKELGIDFNVLAEQADDIYAKYGDKIRNGTFNINDLSAEDLGIGKIVKNAVTNFFTSVKDSIAGFFKSLFSK
ncbi:MAG: DUF1002 domain-containing protein, partial [Clostridia bacterium]|nr:DUF1002 domain-containing protein [Clostridia bacterium]